MADSSRAINRIFTRGVICDLLQSGASDVFDCVVRRYVNDPESKTHGELFSEIYAHLGREKRNEYYYMNTLLNKEEGLIPRPLGRTCIPASDTPQLAAGKLHLLTRELEQQRQIKKHLMQQLLTGRIRTKGATI
jgi:hypothetical protein